MLAILRTIKGENIGYRNHPVTRMWENYPDELVDYGIAICDAWINLGYRDTVRDLLLAYRGESSRNPHWLGNQQLHASHRSNLLRKDYSYYSRYNWTEPTNLPYEYPI